MSWGSIREDLEKKMEQEMEENQTMYKRQFGSNVVYGQNVQLVHIYSSCTLTLNKGILAKQSCCRELSLEEKSNEYSNFRIFSLNNAKQLGEPMFYGDQIIVYNDEDHKWKLGIENLTRNTSFEDGLEVNANENAQPLKLCNYIDYYTEKQIKENEIQGKYLQSGDIITIKNRNLGSLVALKRKQPYSQFLQTRNISYADGESKKIDEKKQDYFVIDNLRDYQTLLEMYELYNDTSDNKDDNIDALWEVQLRDPLTYYQPDYSKGGITKGID